MRNAIANAWFSFVNFFRVNHSLGTITGWQHGAPDELFDIPAYVNTTYLSAFCFPDKGEPRVAYIDYTTGKGYYWFKGQYHEAPVYFHLPLIEFDKFGKGYRINKHAQIKTT